MTTYSHLNTEHSAAKNIKAHLKHLFPNIKFSVRKEDYTSVRVEWSNGVPESKVYDAIKMFTKGSFDGMTDSYDYKPTQFNTTYQTVRYVFVRRNLSKEIMQAGIDLVNQALSTNYTLAQYENGDFIYNEPARMMMSTYTNEIVV